MEREVGVEKHPEKRVLNILLRGLKSILRARFSQGDSEFKIVVSPKKQQKNRSIGLTAVVRRKIDSTLKIKE